MNIYEMRLCNWNQDLRNKIKHVFIILMNKIFHIIKYSILYTLSTICNLFYILNNILNIY